VGNLSIEANISKPLTNDPWVLNQLIHEARRFYRIAPHSVHISLQLPGRHKPVQDRLIPLAAMKCLFALAGDPAAGSDGRVRITRLAREEIVAREGGPHMLFSQISKRHSSEVDASYPLIRTPSAGGRYVQQFKFLRLSPGIDYELVALALKGLQISLCPGTFLTAGQYQSSPRHREYFEELMAWGLNPTPLTDLETDALLAPVQDGLRNERRGKPAHGESYVASAVEQIRRLLRDFNASL
jgi:hypothetical protein